MGEDDYYTKWLRDNLTESEPVDDEDDEDGSAWGDGYDYRALARESQCVRDRTVSRTFENLLILVVWTAMIAAFQFEGKTPAKSGLDWLVLIFLTGALTGLLVLCLGFFALWLYEHPRRWRYRR